LNGQIHGLPALNPGRYLRAHCIGSNVGPLAVLDGSGEEKIIFPSEIRTLDRSTRSQSLYDHAISVLLLSLILLILFVVTLMQGI